MDDTATALSRRDLESLTAERLSVCARRLASRGNLRSSLRGKDATDFVQEAVRRLMDGQRRLDRRISVDDNVVRIALSLVWGERQRQPEESLRVEPVAADAPTVDAFDLRSALLDAANLLHESPAPGVSGRDAVDFIDCLRQQLDSGGSIKPGHIAELLAISRARAYAAWRRIKTVLREQIEGDHDAR